MISFKVFSAILQLKYAAYKWKGKIFFFSKIINGFWFFSCSNFKFDNTNKSITVHQENYCFPLTYSQSLQFPKHETELTAPEICHRLMPSLKTQTAILFPQKA